MQKTNNRQTYRNPSLSQVYLLFIDENGKIIDFPWHTWDIKCTATRFYLKCLLSVNGQRYVQTLCNILSVSRSSNRILLHPFDSVCVSCELICGIELPLRVTMLFLYPHPYHFWTEVMTKTNVRTL